MKKIWMMVSSLLLLFLVACGGSSTHKVKVTVEINDEETSRNEIEAVIYVNDFDKELEGDYLEYKVINPDDSIRKQDTIAVGQVETTLLVTGLAADTTYYLSVFGTISGSQVTLLDRHEIKTKAVNQYIVEKPADLLALKNDRYGDYILANDIDFNDLKDENGNVRTVLSSELMSSSFYGTFDGKGFTIRNLKVEMGNNKNIHSPFGLFGALYSNAKVTDVHFENIIFGTEEAPLIYKSDYSVTSYFGVVAARVYSKTAELSHITMDNIEVNLNVEAPKATYQAGILSGAISDGLIEDITISNAIFNVKNAQAKALYIGGAIGNISSTTAVVQNIIGDLSLNVELNYQKALEVDITYLVHVGGLIGSKTSTSTSASQTLNGLLSYANISLTDLNTVLQEENKVDKVKSVIYTIRIGGIIGYFDNGSLRNAYFKGTIEAAHNDLEETLSTEEKRFAKLYKTYYVGALFGHTATQSQLQVFSEDTSITFVSQNENALYQTYISGWGKSGNNDVKPSRIKWYQLGTIFVSQQGVEKIETGFESLENREALLELITSDFFKENFKAE